jgi:hypothetical protein
VQSRQRARPAAAACRSKPFPVLRFTKLDKVFTYSIVVTRGSRFAHLGMAVAAGDGEATRLASGVVVGKLRCSFGEDEGTKGVAVFNDPSWMVDSARAAAS